MTAARGVALRALAVAVVVVAVLLLRGGGGTGTSSHFQNAGQLVKGDEVQVGGRRVGSVSEDQLTDDNQAADQDRGRGRLRAAARGHDGRRSARPRCRASPTATSR